METSDSDYFESADEDFNDDDVTIISNPKEKDNSKAVSEDYECNLLENVDSIIADKSIERHILHKETDQNKNIEQVPAKTGDASSQNTKDTNSQAKNPKKLGTRLGQKLDIKRLKENSENTTSLEKTENVKSYAEIQDHDMHIADINKSVSEEADLWNETEFDWGEMNNEFENKNTSAEIEREFDDKCSFKENRKSEETSSKVSSNAGWGDWGNWNVSSLLSTATYGVSTITSHVSQGLNNVIESSMGIPEPEEMAKINARGDANELKREIYNQESVDDQQNPNFPSTFGLGNFVSGVSHLTKFVESTGTKVISGGLETLETIGKKTMEVLQDGDPGLKKKRAFLQINPDKPILSQILREAKERAEAENKVIEEHYRKPAKNYEAYFDDHEGLVHLEALELLSKQCSIKLQSVLESSTGDVLLELQETLDQVKELCELPDEEDEDEHLTLSDIKEKLDSAVVELNIGISYEKLLSNWEETNSWLNNLKLNICHETELHQQAIETLAQLTAFAVEQFHKAGELLLIKEHRSTVDEADSLVQLTSTLISFIGMVAAKFSEKLNAKAATASKENAVNSLITNVFFEAGNSSTYIQDAFHLLIPVLQTGAI